MTDAVNPQDVSRAVSEAYSEGLQQGEDYEPSSRRVSEGIQKHLHENFENLAEQAESHNAATGTTDTFDKSNFDKAQAFRTIARLTDGKIQGASEEAGTLNRDELVALYEAAEDGEQFIEMMLATDSFAGLSGMNLGMTGTGRNLKRNENVESPLFKATEKYFENNKYDNRGARGGGQFHDHHFRKGEVGIEVDTQGKDKHELFQEFLEIVDPGATTGELFQVGNVQGADVQGTIGNDAVAMGGAVVESHVDTGLGDDLVVAEEVALVDSQVQTSDGDDRVALQGGAQNAVVDGGDGNDDVRFQGVALDSTFALGGDGDKALLAGQFVNTTIYGDRTFEDSEEGYEAGDGSDEITFAGAARNLQTFAGGGDDQIAIEGHIEDSVFDGGDGDDRMLFRGHYANSRVELGRGNDTALIGDDFTGDLTIHDPKRGRVDWKGKNLKDQDGLLLQGDWTRIDERTFGRLDETGEIVGRVHLDGDVDDLEFIGTDGGEVFQAHQPKQDDPPFLVSALRIAGPVLTVASIAFPAAAPLAIAAKAATAVNAVVSGDPFSAAAAFVSLPGIIAGPGSALAQGTNFAIDGLRTGVALANGDFQGALSTLAGSSLSSVIDADFIQDANRIVNVVETGIDFAETGDFSSLLSLADQGASFVGGDFADTVDLVTDGINVADRVFQGDIPGAFGAGAHLANDLGNEDLARGLAFGGTAFSAFEDGLTLPEGIGLAIQGANTFGSLFAGDNADNDNAEPVSVGEVQQQPIR